MPHCLEMLQRGYRAKYTQGERDFGFLTLRIGGPQLLHIANHARCAPSRDQVLPKQTPTNCLWEHNPDTWVGAVRIVASHLGRIPNCLEVPDTM